LAIAASGGGGVLRLAALGAEIYAALEGRATFGADTFCFKGVEVDHGVPPAKNF
jgi:hypothetical protein